VLVSRLRVQITDLTLQLDQKIGALSAPTSPTYTSSAPDGESLGFLFEAISASAVSGMWRWGGQKQQQQ
jgi:hypothetical protein